MTFFIACIVLSRTRIRERHVSLAGPCMLSLRRASCAFALCCVEALSLRQPVEAIGCTSGQAAQKAQATSQFEESISLNNPYGGSSNANRVIMLRMFFNS